MTELVQAKVWLAGPDFERCTAERIETLGYYVEVREVSIDASHFTQEHSWREEVTRLRTLEEIPFDVAAGSRVTYVVTSIRGREVFSRLECGTTDFPSTGVFNVRPLSIEVKERIKT